MISLKTLQPGFEHGLPVPLADAMTTAPGNQYKFNRYEAL
jgi:hypothetical protein